MDGVQRARLGGPTEGGRQLPSRNGRLSTVSHLRLRWGANQTADVGVFRPDTTPRVYAHALQRLRLHAGIVSGLFSNCCRYDKVDLTTRCVNVYLVLPCSIFVYGYVTQTFAAGFSSTPILFIRSHIDVYFLFTFI